MIFRKECVGVLFVEKQKTIFILIGINTVGHREGVSIV